MNRGLLIKALREVWPVTLLCGVGVMAFEMLLPVVLASFEDQIAAQWFQVEFLQVFVRALLGSEMGDKIDIGMLRSIAWVHPVVLAMLWAHEITLCTRLPAGEVDRGTIDVLFGTPVSRWCAYICETVVWMVAGAVVIGMGLVGAWCGNLMASPESRPSVGQILVIVVNLYCLYLAVGGMALLISSLSDRRGRAVATAFGVVLASFFLNFLTQFWTPAKHISFLGIMNYYKPLLVLRKASWPVEDMTVLLSCGLVLWVAGGVIFNRRDVCTV